MKIVDLRTDVGKQKPEDGSQMTEDRCRKTDIRLTASLKIGQISDHQQSWGYEDGPWKGPGPPLLVATDF